MAGISRRRFLGETLLTSATAGVALSAASLVASRDAHAAQAEAGNRAARAARQAPASPSPNEQLGLAIVGAGGRAGDHVENFVKDKRVKILYICDPQLDHAEQRCEAIEKKTGYRPQAIKDFQDALKDNAVDVVSCASTNHWHTLTGIWSLQAGKHCYLEKPLTYNIHEGKAIVAAARKYGKVVQTGTQCRSMPNVMQAVQFVQHGGIGAVKFARGLCYKRRKAIGPLGDYAIPDGLDYDLWSGPAPIEKVTRERFHYDWHWQRMYGNGDLGNQGPHQTDIARWFLGLDRFPQSVLSYGGRLGYDIEKQDQSYVDAGDVANTEVSIYNYEDKCIVFETRGLETQNQNIPVGDNLGTQVGVIVYGSEGYVIQGGVKGQSYSSCYAYDLKGKLIKEFKGQGNHYSNFIDAVLADNPAAVNADARCGALSAAMSHLGNISYYCGEKNKVSVNDLKKALLLIRSLDGNEATLARTVQHLADNCVDLNRTPLSLGAMLQIDVDKEEIVGNKQAQEMQTRNYRAPYIVPKPEDV